jgi:excisionase family DNA binding protein
MSDERIDPLLAASDREGQRARFDLGTTRKRPRRAEPRITHPETHPRSSVCLAVAAEFLGISGRTVRARIEAGELHAYQDGKVYRIALADLVAYQRAKSA